MGEAKLEAEKAISAYRDELESKHATAHRVIAGNASSTSTDLDAKVAVDVSTMQAQFGAKKDAMAEALADLVCKVEVKPRAARRQGQGAR